MDMQQAQAAGVFGQGHFGEIDRRQRAAVIAVAHQFGRHFHADIVLRFQCAAADMRGQNHVVEPAQWRLEFITIGLGFDREHIHRCTAQLA